MQKTFMISGLVELLTAMINRNTHTGLHRLWWSHCEKLAAITAFVPEADWQDTGAEA
jgi:hypothetical protein